MRRYNSRPNCLESSVKENVVFAVKIAGLGSYLPERRVTSAELEERLALKPGWIERRTGVCERRYADRETSAGMGAVAIDMALQSAGIKKDEIDVIIGASTGPQQAIPCTAALVQRELGALDGRSVCFDINATCLSFMFALQTSAHLIAAGNFRTIAIYSSEITSRSLNLNQPESAVLFGDASAAAILTRASEDEPSRIGASQFATYSSGSDMTVIQGGGTLHHPNDVRTTQEMNLFHMDGPAIYRKASRLLGPFLEEFWRRSDCKPDTVDWVIPHQASRHGLDFLSARCGFQRQQIFENLATRGNCIAASIPLALCEAVNGGHIQRGEHVLLLGSGAGLTLGAISLIF